MATQYDLPWRTDIFKGWHFYDLSQAYEFRRHYWQVAVLPQSEPLCAHNNERPGKDGFEEARLAFLREYGKDLAADAGR